MFVTYHRVGRSALLPALAAAGVLVIIGGVAAMIAVTTLAIVAIVAVGIKVLRAFGLGGPRRSLALRADDTIEGVVVNRSSARNVPSTHSPQ